ncbi:MAG: pantetheine-phosphate adenylyltransferase [Firmicutes bacterium]|nr:pantetheine-phosphate adenylyltransferase [Bacillota bacterium]
MRIGVYPGSFDPVTNGHLDILERSSKLFDRVVVAVIHNPQKRGFFTIEERVDILKNITSHNPKVSVDSFSGLLMDYVKNQGAQAVIRGLRAVSDFDYEMQMALMNNKLSPEIETIFIISCPQYIYLSSTKIKEVAILGGCIHGLVPSLVEERLKEKIKLLGSGS